MAKHKKRVKKLTSVNKALTKQVSALHDELAATDADLTTTRAELARAKAKVAKWKARAAAAPTLEPADQASGPQTSGAQESAAPQVAEPEVVETEAATPEPVAESAPAAETEQPVAPGADEPGPAWTVTRLRDEVRRRGLTGHSRSTKDQLLAALAG